MQCTSYHNFLHKKIPYLHALQGNGEMGARYLDSKYSRWISVDPALGEYVPAAGKGNSENAGNLPGMGGIYNHINGDLYHYAGNNPVRYIDPDGRTNYVFYDPESFFAQAKAEATRMPVEQEKVVKEEPNHYMYVFYVQEETVLIPVTTEKEFIDAWNNMKNPTDVTLIFHGSVHTLNIDYKNNEYLSTSPDGKTPLGNPGTYIGSLEPKTIGTLKIYSCQGGNIRESDNVAQCFKNNNTIGKLFASDGSLSFTRGKYEPKKSHEGRAEYKQKYNQEPQGLVEVK